MNHPPRRIPFRGRHPAQSSPQTAFPSAVGQRNHPPRQHFLPPSASTNASQHASIIPPGAFPPAVGQPQQSSPQTAFPPAVGQPQQSSPQAHFLPPSASTNATQLQQTLDQQEYNWRLQQQQQQQQQAIAAMSTPAGNSHTLREWQQQQQQQRPPGEQFGRPRSAQFGELPAEGIGSQLLAQQNGGGALPRGGGVQQQGQQHDFTRAMLLGPSQDRGNSADMLANLSYQPGSTGGGARPGEQRPAAGGYGGNPNSYTENPGPMLEGQHPGDPSQNAYRDQQQHTQFQPAPGPPPGPGYYSYNRGSWEDSGARSQQYQPPQPYYNNPGTQSYNPQSGGPGSPPQGQYQGQHRRQKSSIINAGSMSRGGAASGAGRYNANNPVPSAAQRALGPAGAQSSLGGGGDRDRGSKTTQLSSVPSVSSVSPARGGAGSRGREGSSRGRDESPSPSESRGSFSLGGGSPASFGRREFEQTPDDGISF